ncbi:putative E3 ubiquitin-protein ligase ARI8 [Hordeum vulgare]|nr:putative E3 ubiquitin-protein ligase ARI8 [Hordeum vulgare]
MLSYNPEDPATMLCFYHTTHSKLWKVLFKPQKTWQAVEEDTELDATHPLESWLEKTKQINYLTLLLEGPRTALLTTMLVKKPYIVPEKKEKKKEA